MPDRLISTCHCGQVKLNLPSNSIGVLACHCKDCQKMHGNFNAFLAVDARDVGMEGSDWLNWYQSSPAARRAFCKNCGAQLIKEVTGADRWLISAGSIEGATGKKIIRNLWVESKPDWYDLPEVRS